MLSYFGTLQSLAVSKMKPGQSKLQLSSQRHFVINNIQRLEAAFRRKVLPTLLKSGRNRWRIIIIIVIIVSK